jgi:hypothetical protein
LRRIALLFTAPWLCSCATPPDPRPDAEIIREQLAAQTARHAGNPDMLVLPGLVADRRTGVVTVQGRTTDLEKGGTAEFILIGPDSAHGYEALAGSFSAAADVHRALEFIGIPAGRPYNPDRFHFWPKGERARVSFSSAGIQPVRVETLIMNRRVEQSMPLLGFVFTGSQTSVDPTNPAVTHYAADSQDPQSIISTYNEPTTVLDLPGSVSQSDAYGTMVSSPENPFPSHTLINVMFQREDRTVRRFLDMTLSVRPVKNTDGVSLAQLSYTLSSDGRTDSVENLNAVLLTFAGLCETGCTPFVTLDLHPEIRLSALQELTALLMEVQSDQGIRLEPPRAGQPFLRAFASNPDFREREKRPEQPLELRLSQENGTVQAKLFRIQEEWAEAATAPTQTVTGEDIGSPEALKAALDADNSGIPALVIFAPAPMRLGDFSSFIAPAYTTHPLLHIFLTDP